MNISSIFMLSLTQLNLSDNEFFFTNTVESER